MAKNDRAVLGYIWGEDNLGYRMCAKSQLKIGTIIIWSIQINEMTSGCDPKILTFDEYHEHFRFGWAFGLLLVVAGNGNTLKHWQIMLK